MEGGRERVGTRMRCVCVRMDCLWGQMGVKKKDKKKNLLVGGGGWTWVVQQDGVCTCIGMQKDGYIRCVRTQISVNKKQKRKNLLMGGVVDTACACGRGWGT